VYYYRETAGKSRVRLERYKEGMIRAEGKQQEKQKIVGLV